VTTTPARTACPRCSEPTVSLGLAHPWCAACDWNLDRALPSVVGWKWIDRRLHRVATRLTDGQFTALADGPLVRGSMSAARAVTIGAALTLIAGVFAIAAAGVWLLCFEPGFVAKGLGVVLLGTAVVLRPRLGRLATASEDARQVERTAAPELFGLVERVAIEVSAPLPHVVLIGQDLNASTTTVGLRRRRVLRLGLPLFATLDPQERVALIGHELGHFVNGDVRRGPLTHTARTTLGRVAALFAPPEHGYRGIIDAVSRSIGGFLSRTALLLQTLLLWTSLRDSQRAEYLADELGARAGGSDAAIRLTDHLLLTEAITTVIQREARAGNGIRAWRAAADTARANQATRIPLLRRLSRRTEPSLFASHPPQGLRSEMLERRPRHPAAVHLSEAASARIDGELAGSEARVRRVLADGGLAPRRRPMRKTVLAVAAVVLLGLVGQQVVKGYNGPRPIVVVVDPGYAENDYQAVAARLLDTPGVTAADLYGYQNSQLMELATGTRAPHWFQVTTSDRAAMNALRSGRFVADLQALPAVRDVYFDCRDLPACLDRERRD
jgi:heat shock protein HtpX